MKKIALILVLCLLLTGLVGCAETKAPAGGQSTGENTNQTTQTPEETTEAPTQNDPEQTTEAPTEDVPEQTTEALAPAGPQAMDLVGSWKRTHTEVEGDRVKNTKATLTITGDSESSLKLTFKDKEFPDTNFKNKALTIKEGELYNDCGNDAWLAEVASTGKYSYALTLLEDGTVVLQCSFEIDGAPMVSYQWFAKSE